MIPLIKLYLLTSMHFSSVTANNKVYYHIKYFIVGEKPPVTNNSITKRHNSKTSILRSIFEI